VRGFSPGGVDAYSPNGDFGRPCRGARRSNGCYDLFHPGHISLLKSAAAECDRLIVAINSDESVRRLGRRLVHKPSRPFQIWPDAWLDQRSSERKKDTSVPTIAGRLPLTAEDEPQHYLEEFVFRFNPRRTRHAAFGTLIGACTAPAPLSPTDPQSRLARHNISGHRTLVQATGRAFAIHLRPDGLCGSRLRACTA
jgi:cytidyltransferase-like protein